VAAFFLTRDLEDDTMPELDDTFGLRLSVKEFEKLDTLRAAMSEALGTKLSRSAVMRSLLAHAKVPQRQPLEVSKSEA
jgi:hypothetical protein